MDVFEWASHADIEDDFLKEFSGIHGLVRLVGEPLIDVGDDVMYLNRMNRDTERGIYSRGGGELKKIY